MILFTITSRMFTKRKRVGLTERVERRVKGLVLGSTFSNHITLYTNRQGGHFQW
jgi:hypothetical protein